MFARSADSRSLLPFVQPRRDLLKRSGLAALTGGLTSLMPALAR
ncbi:MAG: twin-arginine translocation signal domain-containing protein, partial [Planctomycetota bacterium]